MLNKAPDLNRQRNANNCAILRNCGLALGITALGFGLNGVAMASSLIVVLGQIGVEVHKNTHIGKAIKSTYAAFQNTSDYLIDEYYEKTDAYRAALQKNGFFKANTKQTPFEQVDFGLASQSFHQC